MADRIKVLIVDDSRLFRSALEQALGGQDDITVVGSVFSGAKALEFIRQNPPDGITPFVITLDVEMPGMDGLQTLEQIQRISAANPTQPPIGVVMVSAFTQRGADITVKALQSGAFDFVAKPSGASPEESLAILRDEILSKIRAFGRHRGKPRVTGAAHAQTSPTVSAPVRTTPIRAIAIGASTGGPRALAELLPDLCARIDLPIVIVQHMPAGFTASLADSLSRQTCKRVVEATDGMPVQNGSVYIAPGGRHLVIRGSSFNATTGLNDQPPENGCRPSADVLFRSTAAVFGSALAAIILTGMGRDGTAGLGAVKRAGGYVIAQDEASSVVWGMPGSAYEAGVTNELLPLNQIALALATVVKRSGS